MRRLTGLDRENRFTEERQAFPFLVLALVVIGFVSMYPLIRGTIASFFVYRPLLRRYEFAGLDNFRLLFGDPLVIRAFVNTIIWTAASVAGQFILSYSLANMLNSRYLRLRRVFLALTLVPWATPPVVVALMWRFMFTPEGPINSILAGLGVSSPPNWLTDPELALWTCIIANIWMGIPFVTVMLLAGLQTIDKELLEAAAIDGAGYWRTTWSVILPSIKKVVLIVLTLGTIWTFNMFDIVFVLTRGGPGNASLTLPLYAYQNVFWFHQPGYGAAVGVGILVCLLVVVVTYIRQALR